MCAPNKTKKGTTHLATCFCHGVRSLGRHVKNGSFYS